MARATWGPVGTGREGAVVAAMTEGVAVEAGDDGAAAVVESFTGPPAISGPAPTLGENGF